MNFDFTAGQYELRDRVRAYLDDPWPTASLRAAMPGPGLPRELWDGLAEVGVFTVLVPEEHDGLGLSLTDASLLFECFGETLTPGLVADTMLAGNVIARFGSQAQKAELLPALAQGRLKVAMAIGDSPVSFDPAAITTRAEPAGNGWVLDGHKPLVPYGQLADRVLVAARTGEQSLAFFLLDPASPGVDLTPHVLIDPNFRACNMDLSGVKLPGEALIGSSTDGAAVAHAMRTGAAAASAQLTGIAGRALGMTLDYVKQRKQFGRAIGSFQAIKHKLADMMVTYETSRSAAYYAHWALAQGHAGQVAAVSLAKAYAGDMARAVANESVHIHGGIGFTWEYDLHFFLKRAKVLEYSAGDAAWHREQYARATLDG